jgi:hypothetical protein
MVIAWLGALQPDGVLAAVLPNRFLAEAGAAAFRQRFLAQGRLLAAISLPGDFGVCLFRKRGTQSDAVSSSPAALLISPTRTMQTTADRNRYLAEALEKARAVLADGVTPTGSAVPASSPPPRSARRQSPG